MAKVSADVIDEIQDVETVEDVTDVEGEETTKRKREDWQGGYEELFDDVDSCKANPPLRADGSPAVDEDGDDVFAVYTVEIKDAENKLTINTHYTWARNNQEASVNYLNATQNIKCSKLDGKRGRQKLFKPDSNLVMLLQSMQARNDDAGISQFLGLFPPYSYVIEGGDAPEFAN